VYTTNDDDDDFRTGGTAETTTYIEPGPDKAGSKPGSLRGRI